MNHNPVLRDKPYAKPVLPYVSTPVPDTMDIWVICPICSAQVRANIWSLQRQGKKCNCGALFRADGYAEARR